MAIGVGDFMEVIAVMSFLGQTVENVFHWVNLLEEVNEDDALLDAATIMDNMYSVLTDVMSSNLAFVEVVVNDPQLGVSLGSIAWPTLTVGGETGVEVLPSQVSALLTMPTSVSRCRGRKFFPGMHEANLSSGLFNSDVTDDLALFGAGLLSGQSGEVSNWQYVVKRSGLENTYVLPSAAIVTNIPSTLTRRRIGVGE